MVGLVTWAIVVLTLAHQASATLSVCSGGSDHFCALETSTGEVRCWGRNVEGQLGRDDGADNVGSNNTYVPKAVPLGKPAVQIACGGHTSCALLQGGSLVCWGYNAYGQCGQGISNTTVGGVNGTRIQKLPPVDLGKGAVAEQVAMGKAFTCVLLKGGKVKCFGDNRVGQLGHERNYTTWGNSTQQMGDKLPAIGFTLPVVSIDAGGSFACAIFNDSSLRCWGDNQAGQLGFADARASTYLTNVDGARRTYGDQPGDIADLGPVRLANSGTASAVQVAVGLYHVCVLLKDGSVKCWGSNAWGQLGFQTMSAFYPPPAPNGSSSTYVLANDAWADQEGEILRTPAVNLGKDVGDVVEVAAGGYTTCATFAPGTVKCWGRNNEGSLGLGIFATVQWMGDSVGFVDEPLYRVGDNQGEMGDALSAINLGNKGYMVRHMALTKSEPFRDDPTSYDWTRFLDVKCAVLHINYIKCWGRDFGMGLLLTRNSTRDTMQVVGSAPSQMGNNLPFAKLYDALPPMPPSPSPPPPPSPPPSSPPPPPSPNPPYPSFDLSQSRELAVASLPANLMDAFSNKNLVFYVDQGQPANFSGTLSAINTEQSFTVTVKKTIKDNGLVVAAIVLGSITGAVVLVGLCAALWYGVIVSRGAPHPIETDDDLHHPPRDSSFDAAAHKGGGTEEHYAAASRFLAAQQQANYAQNAGATTNPLYTSTGVSGGGAPPATTLRPLAEGCEIQAALDLSSINACPSRIPRPPSASTRSAPGMDERLHSQHEWVTATLLRASATGRPASGPGPVAEGDETGATSHATSATSQQPTGQPNSTSPFDTAGDKTALVGTTTTSSPWAKSAALDDETQEPPPTKCMRIKTALRTLPPAWMVSIVNPKLNIFQGAAPLLALVSGALTLMAFLVLLFVMVSQCNQLCATTPVFQIDPSSASQCVALRATDVLPQYDGTGVSNSLHSSVLLGKCSVLHMQQCAQSEWAELSFCLGALRNYSDVNTPDSSAPSWLSMVDAFNANAKVSSRCRAATSVATGRACGTGSVAGDVCWLLTVTTVNPTYDTSSCDSSLDKPRCSQVSYRASVYQTRGDANAASNAPMCSPGSSLRQGTLDSAFSISDPKLCAGDRFISDDGVRCLGARFSLCQEVDGGGAGMCLRFDTSDSSDPAAEPGILFGPGVLAKRYPALGFSRDAEGHCAPWPLRPLYTAPPVTRALLATLVSSMSDALTARRLSFVQSGQGSDIRATTTVADVMLSKSGDWIMHNPVDLGGGPLAAYFTNTNLYCCLNVCPTWLSSIGSALGFAAYVEMAMMFVVIVMYLLFFNRDLARHVSLNEVITEVVVNQQPDPTDLHSRVLAASRNQSRMARSPSASSSANGRSQSRVATAASVTLRSLGSAGPASPAPAPPLTATGSSGRQLPRGTALNAAGSVRDPNGASSGGAAAGLSDVIVHTASPTRRGTAPSGASSHDGASLPLPPSAQQQLGSGVAPPHGSAFQTPGQSSSGGSSQPGARAELATPASTAAVLHGTSASGASEGTAPIK